MRSHRSYPLFDLWRDAGRLRRVVSAETLAVARVEPMMRQANGFGVVDLTFVRSGEIAVVPFVHVEGSMLAEPERSPLVWPRAAADAIDAETADAIEEKILPWLLSNFLGRRLNDETIRTYDDAGGAIFERARAYGFLGASPYARVALAAAPYVYALRLVRGKRVAVADDVGGAGGAAMLSLAAGAVVASFGSDERDAFARAWYADRFASAPFEGSFDAAIGPAEAALPAAPVRVTLHAEGAGAIPVARPIATDVLFSFDPEDSERAASFAVSTPELALRRAIGGPGPAAVGGSAGRVLFVLRGDAARADDADGDDALALARRLRAEGFEVDLQLAPAVGDPAGYDLVHGFTLTAAAEVGPVLARARAAGIPVVATAHLDDIVREGVWGAGISAGIHMVTTDDEVAAHMLALERRALEAENLHPKGQEPYAGYADTVRAALASCDVVLVSGTAEERLVREGFGFGGSVVPVGPFLPVPDAAAETGLGALVGDADFILAHGPIAARSNFILLAQAAMRADLPLVIAGPVVETGYAALLRELGDHRIVLLTTAGPDAVATLYRRARVFADIAWEDRGPARAAAAALGGASLVLAQSHYAVEMWRPGLWTADRAALGTVVEALRGAWAGAGSPEAAACAARVAANADPVMSLAGVAGAYAKAQSLRSGD